MSGKDTLWRNYKDLSISLATQFKLSLKMISAIDAQTQHLSKCNQDVRHVPKLVCCSLLGALAGIMLLSFQQVVSLPLAMFGVWTGEE